MVNFVAPLTPKLVPVTTPVNVAVVVNWTLFGAVAWAVICSFALSMVIWSSVPTMPTTAGVERSSSCTRSGRESGRRSLRTGLRRLGMIEKMFRSQDGIMGQAPRRRRGGGGPDNRYDERRDRPVGEKCANRGQGARLRRS